MSRTMAKNDVLVAVSFRFYATEVVNVVENVAAGGISIIAITDSTLSPLAKSADVLFAVPEHEYTFSRSLAAPMCLAQALTVALAARLQNNAEDAVGLINLENRSAITELSVRLDRTGAVRRLEDIATARRRLNGNGNPVLVFEALFCALIP
mgnify:CR=1 FL=1